MTAPEWQIPEPRGLARCSGCGCLITFEEWKREGHWLTGTEARKLNQIPLEMEERR